MIRKKKWERSDRPRCARRHGQGRLDFKKVRRIEDAYLQARSEAYKAKRKRRANDPLSIEQPEGWR